QRSARCSILGMTPVRKFFFMFLIAAAPTFAGPEFAPVEAFLKQYCLSCHTGAKPSAGYDVRKLTEASLSDQPLLWRRAFRRVTEHEMPPRNAPAPSLDAREAFSNFVDYALRSKACADGISPARALSRRLNRSEYAATVRDLLNIHINAGAALPADGAGGEGFDNAAETLFLSPVHAEKYLEAARIALDYAMGDPKSREVFLVATPGDKFTPTEAARKVLDTFLPRAFRRPVEKGEAAKYMALFEAATARGESYDEAISYALQGVLISPNFLFRVEQPNTTGKPRPVPQFELASRLSYFLWGSAPDDQLLRFARQKRFEDPNIIAEEAIRLIRSERSREFAENFVEQWLATRELGRDIKPDPALFADYYEPEVESGIRYEPILFVHEILQDNHSLLNLIDSNWTVMATRLQRYYGLPKTEGLRQQPRRVLLPPGSHRGGLLGMAAILAVSSVPTRTSPVLRGKWLLESFLGTPPPPPAPNVPPLAKEDAAAPATVRERLTLHRQNPYCAACHSKIDPWGFALENYDSVGRWRDTDAGKPVDASGELPNGLKFHGPEELKKVLMERRDLVIRNLTAKMMGYALGRSLTLEDSCAVDEIVEQVKKEYYSSYALIRGIVLSTPFRFQAPEPDSAAKETSAK
ncbi:MAG: DUF1588 domain-containing protein, partial [Bryobacteraceae bacterium]|nr:DUF1588 domain-containing protein [Bryobacteraceae bacterium]